MKEYNRFVDMLRNHIQFAFARYNDGEMACVLGRGTNISKEHAHYGDLSRRLSDILMSEPPYFIGAPYAYMDSDEEICRFIFNLDLDLVYVNVFHRASQFGLLGPFLSALSKRMTTLVGPEHLRRLEVFKPDHFIEIPSKNCWLEYDRLYEEIETHLQETKDRVVLFCASAVSEVFIDDLHTLSIFRHTLIDIGSLFDPYVGIKSRGYMREISQKYEHLRP